MPDRTPDPARAGKGIKRELAQRVWAERDARVDRNQYMALFMANPVPMWIYDVETLNILAVNDAALESYGYSRDEFMCLTLPDLRPPEDVPKFRELTAELPNSDQSGPWRHVVRNGNVIQVLITSHAVSFENHPARLVMSESFTEDSEPDLD